MIIIDGKIAEWKRGTVTATALDSVIDMKNHYIMPPLFDAHHHMSSGDFDKKFSPERQISDFQQLLKFGITGVFNPNMSPKTEALFDSLHTDSLPRWETTGPSMGAVGGWGNRSFKTEAERFQFIADQAKKGRRFIKLVYDDMTWLGSDSMPMFSVEELANLIDRAHAYDMKVMVHAPIQRYALVAARLEADVLVHGIADSWIHQDLMDYVTFHGTVIIPNLILYDVYADLPNGINRQQLADRLNRIPDSIYQRLKSPAFVKQWESRWNRRDSLKARLPRIHRNVVNLYRKGTKLVAGTDAGTPGILSGVSLIAELELLVEAGLFPFQAIQLATVNPAQWLGEHDRGQLRPGFRADFIVLKQNPLEDIRALRRVEQLWISGHLIQLK